MSAQDTTPGHACSLQEKLRFAREQCQELMLLANLPGVMPGKPLANCIYKLYNKPGANPWQSAVTPGKFSAGKNNSNLVKGISALCRRFDKILKSCHARGSTPGKMHKSLANCWQLFCRPAAMHWTWWPHLARGSSWLGSWQIADL
jgi:hypothetical protein